MVKSANNYTYFSIITHSHRSGACASRYFVTYTKFATYFSLNGRATRPAGRILIVQIFIISVPATTILVISYLVYVTD
jgi:hypothetical protein